MLSLHSDSSVAAGYPHLKSQTLQTHASRPTPFLKWAGGKGQLLYEFKQFFPSHFQSYYEPFLGGGAVFFYLASANDSLRATISDSNNDLINSYVVVRDALDQLLIELAKLQKRAMDRHFFYSVARKRFNEIKLDSGSDCNVEKAAFLLFLNKTCYNGLYRVNKNNQFNVPWGRYKNPRIYDVENLRMVNEILSRPNIRIECSNYFEAVKGAKAGDFVYFDPPYQPTSHTASFTSYTPESFGEADQVKLARAYQELDARRCLVMLSNSPRVLSLSPDLYKGYRIERVKATRAINRQGNKRGPVEEIVILNY